MDKIEFAKRCMEHSDPYYICGGGDVYTFCSECPVDINKAVVTCTDERRKAWAMTVIAEQTRKELKEIRVVRTTFGSKVGIPEDAVTPKFESKTRGGYRYEIYKIRTDGDNFPIHGAVKSEDGSWFIQGWTIEGNVYSTADEDECDLIPLKKRRFKTAEELVANRYGILDFRGNGQITVVHCGKDYTRMPSDVPDGNYNKEWLDVFTTLED